jgi:hypothetical protein
MVGHFDLVGAWQIHQGFAYSVRFTFPSDYDLTGYSAIAQIRRGPGAADPPYADVVPTIAQDAESLWYVQMDLTDSETAAIPGTQSAEYEIALTSAGGSTDYGFEGTAHIRPKVIA